MSVSTTSAPSRLSPDLKVRSITRPVLRLRSFTRLKACPLPGFTNTFSIMAQGSPSSITYKQPRNSLVLNVAILSSFIMLGPPPPAPHRQGGRARRHTSNSKAPMLQRNPLPGQRPPWQIALSEAVRTPAELLELLHLPRELLETYPHAARQFPLRVPRSYVARMRKGDPLDPLLRQVLPLAAEDEAASGYVDDPVGDLAAMPTPGVLHNYAGRALLATTGACGVHCRYCFRRHFPYAEANPAADHWRPALAHIASDTSITEVILSGGDPFSLTDARLAELTRELATLPHVRRLRIHTRMPIVLPARVDEDLLAWLGPLQLQKVIVVHANHTNKNDNETRAAQQHHTDSGATLLNQSVLLRGVYDAAAALADLSEALFAAGVLPYYLHLGGGGRG